MASPLRKSSFGGGEVTPQVQARVDLESFNSWLKTCRNFIVVPQGGVKNRTGTRLVAPTKVSGLGSGGFLSQSAALLPFVFSQAEAYILEFGGQYIRFVRNGGQIVDPASPPDPYEILSPYATDEAAEIKGRTAESADVMFVPHHAHPPMELRRHGEADWDLVDLVLKPDIDAPDVPVVAGVTVGDVNNPLKRWIYVATALDAETGGESYASAPRTVSINLSSINPSTVTISPVEGASGYNIYRGRNTGIFGYVGTTNDTTFLDDGKAPDYTTTPLVDPAYILAAGLPAPTAILTIDSPCRDTHQPTIQDPIHFIPYYVVSATGPGIESNPTQWKRIPLVADVSAACPTTLTWTPVVGATGYRIYRTRAPQPPTGGFDLTYGLVGTSAVPSFVDAGTPPNTAIQPIFPLYGQAPGGASPIVFDLPGKFPSVAALFEQRLILAATDLKPDTVFSSRLGNYRNFGSSSPAGDDDAFEFAAGSPTVDRIRGLLPSRVLMMFTAAEEYVIRGLKDGAIGPASTDIKSHAQFGCSGLAPLAVGGRALFMQAEGPAVREFRYDFQLDGYTADDERSLLASHMLEGHAIIDWAYDKTNKVVWLVREDGVLLGMTYLPQHDVIAWHRHETDGFVEAIACIPENNRTATYIIARRVVNVGVADPFALTEQRFIERFADRNDTDPAEGVFLDCSLTYRSPDFSDRPPLSFFDDGFDAETTTNAGMPTGDPYFLEEHLGTQIVFTRGGKEYRATIILIQTPLRVVVRWQRSVPLAVSSELQIGIRDWSHALKRFQFSHLIGRTVSALVDGNAVHGLVVGLDGVVEIPTPGVVVTVGLPYTSEIETLDISVNGQGQTIQKVTGEVWFNVVNSRGLYIGEDLKSMRQWKSRDVSDGTPNMGASKLKTVKDSVSITGGWDHSGHTILQQRDPLPCQITSVTPKVQFGA